MFITYYSKYAQPNVNYAKMNISDIYKQLYDESIDAKSERIKYSKNFYKTHTKILEQNIAYNQKILDIIKEFNKKIKTYSEENFNIAYDTFYIPKASGGYREINAPFPDLKRLQTEIKEIIEDKFKMLTHDCAYAYVQGRDALTAVHQHQLNNSKWFLKLDIKDFFPSCTKDFVFNQLCKIYPFGAMAEENSETLKRLLSPCFRLGALPQGSPASPTLSNLVMLPYDYEITKKITNYNKHKFIYTRYADDILISCKEKFDPKEIALLIEDILKDSPFRIKREKTRFGSAAGRNWNLGLMLNKDNDITIGYKEKQRLRAALFSFFSDLTNNKIWDIHDIYILQGRLSYLYNIEPEYTRQVVEKYNQKFKLNLKQVLKEIIGGTYNVQNM